MRPRVAVIGGGISGLAAARQLTQSAPSVELILLEAGSRIGGVLKTSRSDGFLIESAADNFLTNPPAAVELCCSLGLEHSLIAPRKGLRHAFVVHKGQLQPIPEGFAVMAPSRLHPVLASPVLSVRGKLRMALEYFIPRGRLRHDEALANFVRRRFGGEVLQRLVQPLVGAIYTADVEQLSLAAAMPQFRQMEQEHGSLIRAMLVQRRKRPSGDRGSVRAGRFASLRDGMSSLIDALAQSVPEGSVELDSPVEHLMPLANQRWLLSIGGARPRTLEADGVIVATPAFRAADMLESVDADAAGKLAEIEYVSSAIVALGYRRYQIRHPLDGPGFVVPLQEHRTILCCSFSSQKYDGRASDGDVLLRIFIGGACQSGLLRLPPAELIELAEQEVVQLLDIAGRPVFQQLTRHHRAMPQYRVGHCDLVQTIKQRLTHFPTLELAGNAYSGVGVPACIQSGQVAADRLLKHLNAHVDVLRATLTGIGTTV
ncbi:MAG TPA: protoporphyrinogen oxidase [Lacipirellula sp.]